MGIEIEEIVIDRAVGVDLDYTSVIIGTVDGYISISRIVDTHASRSIIADVQIGDLRHGTRP